MNFSKISDSELHLLLHEVELWENLKLYDDSLFEKISKEQRDEDNQHRCVANRIREEVAIRWSRDYENRRQ